MIKDSEKFSGRSQEVCVVGSRGVSSGCLGVIEETFDLQGFSRALCKLRGTEML